MDPNLDQSNKCPSCEHLISFHKRFCNAECRDVYESDRRRGVHLRSGNNAMAILAHVTAGDLTDQAAQDLLFPHETPELPSFDVLLRPGVAVD